MNDEIEGRGAPRRSFAGRVAVAVAIALGLTALALVVWEGARVFLLLFAGYLVAILLREPTEWLERRGMRYAVAYALVLLLVIVLLVGLGWFLAPRIDEQATELADQLPRAVDDLRDRLADFGWVQWLLDRLPIGGEEQAPSAGPDGQTMITHATDFLSTTFGGLVQLVILLFVGIYLAAAPGLYKDGLLRLVPPRRRPRAREVLEDVDRTLHHWLVGRLVSMTIIGVATWIGLALLGIPLALTLGVLAAVLTFIPNFGPVLSAVPPVLLALLESPRLALWVVLLYLGIQAVESYLVTPMIQQKAVSLPPALIVLSQVLLGILFGFLGFALATPLAAAGLVLVRRLYVEGLLEGGPEGAGDAA